MAINDDDDFEPLGSVQGADDDDDFEPIASAPAVPTAADMAPEGAGVRAAEAWKASKNKTLTVDGTDLRGGPSSGEAFFDAAANSAVGGFLDEAAGAVKGLAEAKDIRDVGDSYRRERDAIRARQDELTKAHPTASMLGGVAGGLATAALPIGAAAGAANAAKGAGALARAGAAAKAGATTGAKVGAATGLGYSGADLTEGNVTEAAKDVAVSTAIGAGAGAAIGGAGSAVKSVAGAVKSRVVDKAAARVEKRAINDILEGVPAKLQDNALARLGGKDGALKAVKEEGLERAIRGPLDELDDAVSKKVGETGSKIGEAVKAIDAAAPDGADIVKLTSKMEETLAKYQKLGNTEAARAIQAEISGLNEIFAPQMGRVTAEGLHAIRSRLGGRGWGSNFIGDPSAAQKIARELFDAADKVFMSHVDDVAKARGVAGAEEIKALNKQYSRLKAFGDLVEAKATRMERNSPTLGQRMTETLRKGTDVAGAAGALGGLMTGNIGLGAAAAAAPVLARMLPKAAAVADRAIAGGSTKRLAIAELLNAAKRGAPQEELLQLAASRGLPEQTALNAMAVAQGAAKRIPGRTTTRALLPAMSGNDKDRPR